MTTLIAIVVSILTYFLTIYLFDGTQAEGYIAFLVVYYALLN